MIPPLKSILELQRLLGPCVLLKWPVGRKGGCHRWKHLTLNDMSNEYLTQLTDCNVGVALGRVSEGLCAIDLDHDELIQSFRNQNPWTARTTITRGARGCQVWVRVTGAYPASATLLLEGAKCGEWRADGNQSIVPPSIHPETNAPYTFISDHPVVKLEYPDIRYPDGMIGPLTTWCNTQQTQPTEFTQSTQLCSQISSLIVGVESRPPIPSSISVPDPRPPLVLDQLVAPYVATSKGKNNDRLFHLAKAVLCARLLDYKVSDTEVFDVWWQQSRSHTRPNLSADDYYAEFLRAFRGIRNDHLIDALRASAGLQAPGTENLRTDSTKRFAAFCFCLQGQEDSFFLSCRAAAKVFLVSYRDTNRWLSTLETIGILAVISKGSKATSHATVYRYVGATHKTIL